MANQLVPSSSFSTTPSWTYDVFLSFRGEDTRYNFTDHLYQALVRCGIRTFIDHSELPTGKEISPTLLEAIENSRISVIIFSENYASSSWCLDELVHILKCRKPKGQMTRPIFYKVEPSDVRHQKNSFGAAFAGPSRKYENDLERVHRWRTALTEAANLKGATLKEGEYETKFINNIVEEISTQVLNRMYLHVANYPVGMESCAKEVEVLLDVGGNDRRVVGIWGTSGIGKTTIAKDVYNTIAHKFEGSCFLADVRETLTSREGLIQLQKTFLSKSLRGTKWEIDDVHEGISLIKNRLRQKKILLILDDVDKLDQLNDWVDVDCFGEGSRVIITTKDRRLLKFYGGQWIYEVQKLGYDKALELFSWNAFKRNRPPDDYLSLARRAIVYAQGLPLALNLIGSYLRNESIGRWQDVLNCYDSYNGEPYTDIQIILRKTYDAWDYDLQQVFLDIACFFKGENEDYVLQVLISSTLNVRQDCIKVLVEKAIITIEYNRILMHDLLQKMGKQIVYEESPTEPGKRSRLWFHEDVYNVLTESQGTEKIRSIVVELPKSDEIPLNPESFLRMVKLEIFINRNAHFSGRVDHLPNSLRWLALGRRSLGGRSFVDIKHTVVLNLSSSFHPRNLVCFDVSNSGIRQLKEFKNLAKLTWMNLSGCEFLEKIPDLSGSPNIKHLNLSGCSNLTRFATRLGLRSLESLHLYGCTRLERFPEIEKDKMKSLTTLNIGESGIRELPSSIAYLTGLRALYARDCELQNVPDLSGSPNIRELDLSHSTSLVEVDDSVGVLDKLETLKLWGCSKLTRFATRLGSRSLRELSLGGCRRLESFPELEGKMESLIISGIELSVGGCELQNIQLLPFGKKVKFDEVSSCSSNLHLNLEGCNLSKSDFLVPLDWWSVLTYLDLSRNNFVSLPDCISKAVNLQTLYSTDCKRLREIPVLPPKLRVLYLNGCTSLEKIPKLPPRLTELTFCNCFGPSGDEVAKLENNWLNKEINPHSQSNIIYTLTTLNLSINNFVSLPDCISKVVHLGSLYLRNCKRLREIPILPPNLGRLDLHGCTSLEKIPKLPLRLEALSLSNCSGLSGDEVAKLENNLLNEELYPRSQLSIIYPSNEISKWFSYISNHPTIIQPLSEYEWDEDEEEFVRGSEFHFEIPLKLQVGETLLGLALSFVVEPSTLHDPNLEPLISINGQKMYLKNLWHDDINATHVRLALVGLGEREQRGDICQVVFDFPNGCPIKSCGVHCLLRNQDELLHLSLRQRLLQRQDPMQFQGRNPQLQATLQQQRLRQQQQILQSMPQLQTAQLQQQQQQCQSTIAESGSDGISQQDLQTNSNMVLTAGRQLPKSFELQSSSEPADVHPKRRQIDLNVPFDIEEDEELLHLSLRPTSSLGKRPHPRGSSDIVDDEYDHPKRRQIDIEEEEEQEQPSASDDPQFQIS